MPSILALRAQNNSLAIPPGGERWLTGYADASFSGDHTSHLGGWGCWVRDHQTRILRSGPCPEWVRNSEDAEACAVFSAIFTALTKLDAGNANIMVIKTDNQGVARGYGWKRSNCVPSNPKRAGLIEKALTLANEKQVRLVVTWVKGHRGAVDTAAYLNTEVDKLAGVARKTQAATFWAMSISGSTPVPRA